MRIVGTAGHVDHGKSTLVQALTGTHPDRLKEEREREMTIELGFASMTYDDGLEVGFVDVPGHIDFIENMLMGVGSIDVALLVVAADEGVMPQTREHLDILRLLEIEHVIVALAKTDLVDKEWLDLVREDLKDFLHDNGLEAPVIPVSSQTGDGLDNLRDVIRKVLCSAPERPDYGKPRLFVDRVFSISGFGTVVTGTLIDGEFQRGDRVEILPSGIESRVRGLQSFNRDQDRVSAGSRVAVNLSGTSVDEIDRGSTLVHCDSYQKTSSLCVRFHAVESLRSEIEHNMEAKLFHGSSQVLARIRVLGSETILPGEQGYLQLELVDPVVARFGDHYILRRPSPSQTLGGGVILDPFPLRRHRRYDEQVLLDLLSLDTAGAEEILEHIIKQQGRISYSRLSILSGMRIKEMEKEVQNLVSNGSVLQMKNGTPSNSPGRDVFLIHDTAWEKLLGRLTAVLQEFHQENPYVTGMSLEVLRSKLDLENDVFQYTVKNAEEEGRACILRGKIRLRGFEVVLEEKDKKLAQQAMQEIKAEPLNTPSPGSIQKKYGSGIFDYLKDQGLIVQVSDQVLFDREQYQSMVEDLEKALLERGRMKVTEVREILPTSRKYLLAFLEHLDRAGVTRRDGDFRLLK